MAEERLSSPHGERARVADAERRPRDGTAAAPRRGPLPLSRGAAALAAHIQVSTARCAAHVACRTGNCSGIKVREWRPRTKRRA